MHVIARRPSRRQRPVQARQRLIEHIGEAPSGLRLAALGMLVAAFATKAALVPLCFWMPATYPTLSAPVAALFAGIMTKLGIYSLLRIVPLLAHEPVLLGVLMWLGALSALEIRGAIALGADGRYALA